MGLQIKDGRVLKELEGKNWEIFDDIVEVSINILEGVKTFANAFPPLKTVTDAILFFLGLAQVRSL
jgi:hypothetical protein